MRSAQGSLPFALGPEIALDLVGMLDGFHAPSLDGARTCRSKTAFQPLPQSLSVPENLQRWKRFESVNRQNPRLCHCQVGLIVARAVTRPTDAALRLQDNRSPLLPYKSAATLWPQTPPSDQKRSSLRRRSLRQPCPPQALLQPGEIVLPTEWRPVFDSGDGERRVQRAKLGHCGASLNKSTREPIRSCEFPQSR